MKKINNNLPRGGAEWGRALRRFLSDNIVPIMFVLRLLHPARGPLVELSAQ